jgi:hypothetical protein
MLTNCIEWHASRDKAGYGRMRFMGTCWLAHRVAWVKAHGEIPPGMCVLHKCDNPPCVNVEHLFLGTQKDNIKDCYEKGRISRATRNAGEKQWKAKISADVAREIKRLKGTSTLREMSEKFGLSKQAIWDIQNGRNWKHI